MMNIGNYFCLGHVVGNGKIQPEESKVRAVEGFPVPMAKKQVRESQRTTGSLLELCCSGRMYTPLTDLTRRISPNRVHMVWGNSRS